VECLCGADERISLRLVLKARNKARRWISMALHRSVISDECLLLAFAAAFVHFLELDACAVVVTECGHAAE
jgi:hypothetical protein